MTRRISGRTARSATTLARLMALTLLAGGSGAAQQQPTTPPPDPQAPAVSFQTDVNFVEVPTIVTDEDGNFVRDLTSEDFELFENGERQDVSVFTLVDLPVRRPFTPVYADAPVDADVYATTPTFEGRIYVLLLDDLHTSALRTNQVRQYAKRFVIDSLGQNDLVAVVYTSGSSKRGQELTSRRSLLLASIDRFVGRKLPSATQARLGVHLRTQTDEAMIRAFTDDSLDPTVRSITRDYEIDDPDDAVRASNARRTLGAIQRSAEWMGDLAGRRKAVVLFSEGFDYDIYAPFNPARRGTRIIRQTQDAIGAAQRANVSVYAVDARGLMQVPGEAIMTAGLSADPAVREGGFLGFQNEVLMAQEGLISMANETGGLAVVSTNDVEGGLDRIVRENSVYYLLGYSTDPDNTPGEFREIEVRVNRPDVQVKARRGFVPPDPSAQNEPRQTVTGLDGIDTSHAFDVALNSPLPIGDLQFRVSAAPFMGKDAKTTSVLVIIEVDGQSLPLKEEGGLFRGRLDASVIALDYDGNILGGDNPGLDLNLRPQTYETVREHGLRLYSRLELPAGERYQLRVGAHETVGGTAGAVPFELEVPNYEDTSLVLSGLVLTSTRADLTPTPKPDAELSELFPTPPSAARVFRPDETIGLFAELYSRKDSPRRRVEFVATVRDASDGRTVFTLQDGWVIEPSKETQANGYAAAIPLKDLQAGMYVLRASVESRGSDEVVFREVPFEIIQD